MKPRTHQAEAIKWVLDRFKANKTHGVVQMPTGSGKSYVALSIAMAWLQMGGCATILAPSEEVIRQLQVLAVLLGLCPVIEKAELHASPFARFVIGSYNTLWRRGERYQKPRSLVIFDECHHVNFNAPVNMRIANLFTHAIGFSATPWSEGCLDFFQERYVYPLSQSIADQVCCNFTVLPWQEPTPGKYQIVYCSDLDEIKQMCRQIAPSDCAVYQAQNPRATIARFRCGSLGTIVVNRMLTEGFDQPQVKRVWIARHTDSAIFALQMLGRTLRPHLGRNAEIYVRSARTCKTLQMAIQQAG